MKSVKTLLLGLVVALTATISAFAQPQTYLYIEPGFNPWNFTDKLSNELKDSPIGKNFKTTTHPTLEKNGVLGEGDLVVQLISSEYRCEGKVHHPVALVIYFCKKDKVGAIQKVYVGSVADLINEAHVDEKVQQFKKIILDASK